jgi:hypothetical protein
VLTIVVDAVARFLLQDDKSSLCGDKAERFVPASNDVAGSHAMVHLFIR